MLIAQKPWKSHSSISVGASLRTKSVQETVDPIMPEKQCSLLLEMPKEINGNSILTALGRVYKMVCAVCSLKR